MLSIVPVLWMTPCLSIIAGKGDASKAFTQTGTSVGCCYHADLFEMNNWVFIWSDCRSDRSRRRSSRVNAA